MSSANRFMSEVPSRVKYFVGIGNTNQYWQQNEGVAKIPSVVTEAEWSSMTNTNQLGSQFTQYRDMGREVTVVNGDGIPVDKYCLVQSVNGPTSEGVYDDEYYGVYYVKVWSATADGSVTVFRTG